MKSTIAAYTVTSQKSAVKWRVNFRSRLFLSLPLMAMAGFCLFGFIGTFDPMPRVAQLSWRGIHFLIGLGSVVAICWLWLRPRRD
jgi:hypothetical protein